MGILCKTGWGLASQNISWLLVVPLLLYGLAYLNSLQGCEIEREVFPLMHSAGENFIH